MLEAVLIIVSLQLVVLILVFMRLRESGDSRRSSSRPGEESQLSFEKIVKEDVSEWLKLAEKQGSELVKASVLEAALYRHPKSKLVVSHLREVLEKILAAEDLLVKREGVQRFARLVEVFSSACTPSDWEYAKQLSDTLTKHTDALVRETKEKRIEQRKNKLRTAVLELKRLADEYSGTRGDASELLSAIAKVDGKIDPDDLEGFPELKAEYQRVSSSVLARVKASDSAKMTPESVRDYNLKAVASAKMALEKFNADKGPYKKGTGIGELAKLLSGWDPRILKQEALTYINTIYGEIFQSLSRDARLSMTNAMIRAELRILDE